MELEVEEMTRATYKEKSQERLVQRNGYRDRAGRLNRTIGSLVLPMPLAIIKRINNIPVAALVGRRRGF
jgi:hypothetical protein